MTTHPHPVGGHVGVRDALATPSLRRSVAAMVRRRVPRSEVEDVAQTILCDALAAPGIPSDPEDLRRFVAGIARHKVADFHRGGARRTSEVAADEVANPAELSVGPAPIEARALLARIADSVATSAPRERETLEWLVREHAGEQLETIAEESGVPAPCVRQRVSRLRRVLRAQWAHALAVLALAGSCAALAERAHPGSAIVADPAGDQVALSTMALQGSWRIESVTPGGDAAASAATTLKSKVLEIRINPARRRVDVVGPTFATTRAITAASRRADGSISIELVDERGDVQHLTAMVSGDRMQLATHDGRLQGTASLVRR